MTDLYFHGQARDAAVWLLTVTGLDRHPMAPTFLVGDPLVVTLRDWHGWSSDEEVVLNTLKSLSTQGFLLDVRSLAKVDVPTRWACVHAVAKALDVPHYETEVSA